VGSQLSTSDVLFSILSAFASFEKLNKIMLSDMTAKSSIDEKNVFIDILTPCTNHKGAIK
jgi:hypothetical protein